MELRRNRMGAPQDGQDCLEYGCRQSWHAAQRLMLSASLSPEAFGVSHQAAVTGRFRSAPTQCCAIAASGKHAVLARIRIDFQIALQAEFAHRVHLLTTYCLDASIQLGGNLRYGKTGSE